MNDSHAKMMKLFLTIFPFAAGILLAGIGLVDLNLATETPELKPNTAYGILPFSSEGCLEFTGGIYFDEIDLKGNVVLTKIDSTFLLGSSEKMVSSYEVTFGFQIPHKVENPDFMVIAFDKGPEIPGKELNILDEAVIPVEDSGASLIYVKCMAPPKCERYKIIATFTLRDLVAKQSFSIYGIAVPFSKTGSNLLTRYIPKIEPIRDTAWGLAMNMPPGSELREALPAPDTQEVASWLEGGNVEASDSVTYLIWNPRQRSLDTSSPDPRSEPISVKLELREDNKLQSRLFFDSGLYTGLGVSLIISGLREALKSIAEGRGAR